ncbi:TIGR03862 family flavoprotein [Roseobacter sp. OBYS 0001]|uniref:TIGR03862 family flavoprotein n=1 Tax=Roseobacter sp. OBYS 0001 TaxID=882651 RepID=UPI001C7E9A54|nr:TIGR03862 family flavoprotein [Roseobacter sp. OBYS 0001]
MSTALVIGAGPAGLMAAETLSDAGHSVIVCDAKPSVGRKFLMAGKSGLNLTRDEPFAPFMTQYSAAETPLRPIVESFDAEAVQHWARGLDQDLFTGSTGRVFPKAMKASPLLRAWLARLDAAGVERRTRWRWLGWDQDAALFDTPNGREQVKADVTVLAMGGASWARLGSDGAWADAVGAEGCALSPFAPSNAAVSITWTDHMAPHFGNALKSVAWQAGGLSSRGEASITQYGLEGGGVYSLTPALRDGAPLFVDLVPDLSAEKLAADLAKKPAKLRLAHWLRNNLRLSPAKIAFFFEMTATARPSRDIWVTTLKKLAVPYDGLRPMDEAISTAGGVRFDAMNDRLMLKSRPGVFCAGEMIDWEAPTGGYLITACLATGRWAGRGAVDYLAAAA